MLFFCYIFLKFCSFGTNYLCLYSLYILFKKIYSFGTLFPLIVPRQHISICSYLTNHSVVEPLKASRPLIRVLVINDNGLWINEFIRDNEYRLIHEWKRFGCERMEFWRWWVKLGLKAKVKYGFCILPVTRRLVDEKWPDLLDRSPYYQEWLCTHVWRVFSAILLKMSSCMHEG